MILEEMVQQFKKESLEDKYLLENNDCTNAHKNVDE